MVTRDGPVVAHDEDCHEDDPETVTHDMEGFVTYGSATKILGTPEKGLFPVLVI